jgi:hypothetical protein
MQTGGQPQAPARARPARGLAPRRRTPRPEADADQREERGLAIALGLDTLPPESIAVDGPAAIDAALLKSLRAERVICPLFTADFDALVVANHLRKLEFQGTLVVVAPDLPNPRMVERELRNQSGGLKVKVVLKP